MEWKTSHSHAKVKKGRHDVLHQKMFPSFLFVCFLLFFSRDAICTEGTGGFFSLFNLRCNYSFVALSQTRICIVSMQRMCFDE